MLLCVLLGYVPDWNNIQKLGKWKIELLNCATTFPIELDQMHILFCCVGCLAMFLIGAIDKKQESIHSS